MRRPCGLVGSTPTSGTYHRKPSTRTRFFVASVPKCCYTIHSASWVVFIIKVHRMRDYSEYRKILNLWDEGRNKSEIEQFTGIPRSTVRDCIKRFGSLKAFEAWIASETQPMLIQKLRGELSGDYAHLHLAYAYIFGLYLGDGNLSLVRKTLRLRITLDAKYPQIIQKCVTDLQTILPNNQIGLVHRRRNGLPSCIDVSAFYKHWDLLLPQHGTGEKHTRPIVLEAWQQNIVDQHPLEFFRGLYHSDGSRFMNRVKVAGKEYEYPRYQFTNASENIIGLFCAACDRISVAWTRKVRRARSANHVDNTDIYISKRADVAYLDSVIGAKS